MFGLTHYRNDDTIPQQLYLSALDGGTVEPRMTWDELQKLEAQIAEEAAREEAAKAADDAA